MNYIEYDKTCLIPPSTSTSNATSMISSSRYNCCTANTAITSVPNIHNWNWRQDRDLVDAFINYCKYGGVDVIYKYDTNGVLKAAEALKEKERARMVKIIWPEVKKIEILKENKVVRVTINNSSYKQICRDGDIFDLRLAVAIALVKNMWGNLTPEGNEYYARHFLLYHKDFNKVVDRGIRAYEKEKREKELEERRKEEIKKIKERRRAKNAMKRKKKREAVARKE